MDLLKGEPGLDSGTYHDRNQVINIKAEDATDMQDDKYPVLITFPTIKAEQEVCFLCTVRHISQVYKLSFVLLYCVCLCVYLKQLPSGE
jgi:hypothetical protein